MIDDVEQPFREGLAVPSQQEAADGQMRVAPPLLRDKGIGRLLYPIVQESVGDLGGINAGREVRCESVGLLDRQHQTFFDRFPEISRGFGRLDLADGGERLQIEPVTDAGGQAQSPLGAGRKPRDLLRHQGEDVVRDLNPLQALKVHAPCARGLVEGDQPVPVERLQQLLDEERVSPGLGQYHVRGGGGVLRVGTKRVCDELAELRRVERGQRELADRHPAAQEVGDHPAKRMSGGHLVVAVGADQQQPGDLLVRHQKRQQCERRRVCPLEIIEKDHQRALGPGHGPDEPLEQAVESVLRLGGAKLRRGALRPEDLFQLRNHIDDHLRVGPERLPQAFGPVLDSLIAFGQRLTDQAPERLHHRPVRNVTRQLVELPGDEVPPMPRKRLVQLVDQRGLADARVPGDEHEFGSAGGHSLERRPQLSGLGFAPIEPLGQHEPKGHVLRTESSVRHGARLVPLGGEARQIGAEAVRALITLLRRLGEQAHYKLSHRFRNAWAAQARWVCQPRNVAVNQLQRVR